ncbi:MAG: tetratricopeptide repeat protein [Alphaproteobacteria bacterium]|nr:tetratricopeptide repeat protein [Alphaproteobacteria bacterium]
MILLIAWSLAFAEPAGAQEARESDVKAQQAAMAFRQGQMSEALRLYDSALEDRTLGNERRASILTDRGVIRERVGRITDAVADFNEAIRLFPEFPVVYNNRGSLLVRIGAPAEAVRDFNRALQLAPGYAAAYSNRAGAFVKLGQFDDAIESYTAAVRLMPTIVEPLAGRAGAYIAVHRPRAALRDLTRAIATDARFSLGYRQRAGAYLRLEEFSAAAADLSRAIAFDPTNADYYLLRGRAYMKGKDPAAAIRDFSKALELVPTLAEAYRERGHASILVEAFQQADEDLAKAVELSPRDALSYAYRALMYKKLGQPELGAQEVEKAMLLDKNNADVLWAKGEIDEAMSRPDAATEAYRNALALEPKMQNAIYGLKRLGETVDEELEEMPALAFDAWRVFGSHGQFFAVNDEIADLQVPLENAGEGTPRLLEWGLQEGEFRHIGLLRFSAGRIEVDGAGVDNEFIAIIDVNRKALLGIEPHRQGTKESKWSWGSGRLVVAALDGLTQEYVLNGRADETVAAQERQGQRGRTSSVGSDGVPVWAPWAQNDPTRSRRTGSRQRQVRRQRKPKTLFDLLFGN